MTGNEFDKLNKRQRADVVWEWGFFVGSRKTGTHTVALFVIADFFCEVYLNSENNKTEEIQRLNYSDLHPDFTKSIDLSNPLVKAAASKNSRTQQA